MLLLLLLTTSLSFGGNEAYHACCAASRAGSCPQTLEAVGPGSASIISGASANITGIWRLSCEGGSRFEADRTRAAPTHSDQGTVITPMTEMATACFDAACHLPTSLCVTFDRGYARVAHCDAGTAPGVSTWEAPPDGSIAVVVEGRVIKVRRLGAVAAVARAERPPSASTAESQAPRAGDMDLSVPNAPPDPCVPNQALRGPSNDQVDLGNELQISGDVVAAMEHYRIAIGINQCNAFAWAALGAAMLKAEWAPGAQTALRSATHLMPTHFQAWTHLALAEERMKRYGEARAAFSKATEIKPGFSEAEEGLRRLDAR